MHKWITKLVSMAPTVYAVLNDALINFGVSHVPLPSKCQEEK